MFQYQNKYLFDTWPRHLQACRMARLARLAGAARAGGTTCIAWRLTDNHLHLILAPESADGLRATPGEAHRRCTRLVNFRVGWRGHVICRKMETLSFHPTSAERRMAASMGMRKLSNLQNAFGNPA